MPGRARAKVARVTKEGAAWQGLEGRWAVPWQVQVVWQVTSQEGTELSATSTAQVSVGWLLMVNSDAHYHCWPVRGQCKAQRPGNTNVFHGVQGNAITRQGCYGIRLVMRDVR